MNITIVCKSGYCNLVGDNSQKFLNCIAESEIAVPVTIITQEVIDKVKNSIVLAEDAKALFVYMLQKDIGTSMLICTDAIQTNQCYIANYFVAIDLINDGVEPSEAIEKALLG